MLGHRTRPVAAKPVVAGLDLSLNHTGLIIARSKSDYDVHPVNTPDKLRQTARLAWVRDFVCDRIERAGVSLVVAEGYAFAAKNQAHQAGELGGVVRTALTEQGVPLAIVAPTSLKKFVTGKGTGTKIDVALAVYKRWGFESSNDNLTDAFGGAMWGLTNYVEVFAKPTATKLKYEWIEALA